MKCSLDIAMNFSKPVPWQQVATKLYDQSSIIPHLKIYLTPMCRQVNNIIILILLFCASHAKPKMTLNIKRNTRYLKGRPGLIFLRVQVLNSIIIQLRKCLCKSALSKLMWRQTIQTYCLFIIGKKQIFI